MQCRRSRQFSYGSASHLPQFAIPYVQDPMDPHSIVVVSLHTPKEKVWGELLAINPSGITLRCIDLNSFDHFIRQINEPDGERMGFPTIFFPMNRLERISLAEPSGSIPSLTSFCSLLPSSSSRSRSISRGGSPSSFLAGMY